MAIRVGYKWKPEYVKMLRGHFSEHPEDRRARLLDLLDHLERNSPEVYRAIVGEGPSESAFITLVVQAGGAPS